MITLTKSSTSSLRQQSSPTLHTMSFVNGALICLAIIVISYFFWNCCQKFFFIRRLNTLPGPKTWPLIGSAHHLLPKNNDDVMDVLFKMAEDYQSLYQIWLGSKLIIGMYKPDEAKVILNSRDCIDKIMFYKFVSPVIGVGLGTAPASIWTKMRTMTAPTFSSNMLQSFFNTFVEQSVILTYKIEKNGLNENEIILLEYISNCTLRITIETLLDTKLEPNIYNQCTIVIQRLKSIFSSRSMNLIPNFFDIIFNLTSLGREQKKYIDFLHSLINKIIQQREDELNNLKTIKDEKKQTHRTFFNVQLDAKRKGNVTREEVRDNVIAMISGSDTITITMTFTIFMLANFPEIQKKVHEELLEIYGTETIKSAPIKYDDLQYMHYLDRVLKETMRIFPAIPIIGRLVRKDLKIGEIVLPKGAEVIIGILKIHRDEKYWPNPLVFDPDRFLPERIQDRHPYCYLPFSDGPRNCIGMKYGMICMKVMLATLVRTFIFKVDKSIEIDEIKLKYNTLLSTHKPLKVKIEKRCFQ